MNDLLLCWSKHVSSNVIGQAHSSPGESIVRVHDCVTIRMAHTKYMKRRSFRPATVQLIHRHQHCFNKKFACFSPSSFNFWIVLFSCYVTSVTETRHFLQQRSTSATRCSSRCASLVQLPSSCKAPFQRCGHRKFSWGSQALRAVSKAPCQSNPYHVIWWLEGPLTSASSWSVSCPSPLGFCSDCHLAWRLGYTKGSSSLLAVGPEAYGNVSNCQSEA